MTTYLGKSCSFGLLRVPFVNCRQFMYLVISLLVLSAGCVIWLCRFLISFYLFTLFFSILKSISFTISFVVAKFCFHKTSVTYLSHDVWHVPGNKHQWCLKWMIKFNWSVTALVSTCKHDKQYLFHHNLKSSMKHGLFSRDLSFFLSFFL